MMKKLLSIGVASAVGITAAVAQIAPPAEIGQAIKLGTGAVPGGNGPEIWFGTAGNMSVRNTSEASLLPVLPDPAKATGTAMVIAPGGGFMTLAWDQEGMKIARVLADHGIAAFVLKYRVDPTPRDWPSFGKFTQSRMADWIGKPGKGLRIVTPAYAIADGIAALKLVRARATQWHVDPVKVGMIGFSAGARTTLRVTLDAAPADRPAFMAMIYPPMEKVTVPADAPPAFVAMATDDPLSGRAGYGLIDSWIAARRPIEFHAYQRGGHGFGLGIAGTTTEGWIDGLFRWIDLNGFGAKAAPPR
jgi:acetyl esterase/lipase